MIKSQKIEYRGFVILKTLTTNFYTIEGYGANGLRTVEVAKKVIDIYLKRTGI